MTPSLLPRPNATQILASVIVTMTLYAIGATVQGVSAAIRIGVASKAPLKQHPRARLVTTVVLGFLAALTTFQGVRWQAEQFSVTAIPSSPPNAVVVVIGTVVGCLLLLYISRGLRWAGRAIGGAIGRKTAWPFALRTLLGGIAVFAAAVALTVAGVAGSSIIFNNMNNSTKGQSEPASALRSGSPESLVGWQTLGYQGRAFVGEGPTPAQIQAVTTRPAIEPIRIYTGLESADGLQAQADLALADLQRAGGLQRQAVIVYTPSTNGLVDPSASAAAEYVLGGDVASVSMQYTVLPSFMSIMLSQSTSLDSGTILFQTIRSAIQELPESQRPKLYVYGESLGAFGSQAPFADKGVDGFTSQADGALWAGPPANSAYWEQISAQTNGGPTWAPIVGDGQVFRFAADAAGLTVPKQPWGSKRAVYLQNATDPVVWWSPDLIASRPGWLNDPRGPAVPAAMRWFPLITFELVAVDMPAAGGMPAGIGHNYLPNIGPAWIAVVNPSEWTPANTVALQAALEQQLAKS